MTTDLLYLSLTAALTATLWIPYITGQVIINGPLKPANYRDPAVARPMPAWGNRAHRVYQNAIETFAPFAALVIVGHIAGKGDAIGAWAMAYFWVRLAHALVYWAGIPVIRTVLFTAGWVIVIGIFVTAIGWA